MLDNKRAVLKLLTALTLLSAVKEISGQAGCRDTQSWCGDVPNLCESFAAVKVACKATCKTCATNSELCAAKNCSQVCQENENRTVAICSCFQGYALDGNGRTCTDIDECATNPCTKPSETCVNIQGSYACAGCLPSNGEFYYYQRDECCTMKKFSQCGQRSVGRISGGESTTAGEWPWMAYIVIKSNLCGGSLISNEWIVTAAHCFAAIDPKQDLGKISVVLGLRNTTNVRRVHEQTFDVAQLIIHPNSTGFESDIALIRLNKPATFTSVVKPVCLPNGETLSEGEKCSATGYGTINYRGAVAKQLQEVGLPVVNTVLCNNSKAGNISVNPQTMMCAGYAEGGIDACQGDSGGPLVCQRCDSCDWYLAGITSFGKGCAHAGVYGVWTKVEQFEQWISEQTAVPVSKSSKCRKAGTSWLSWSTWTKCTKSCATGNSQRQRTCSGGVVENEGCIGATSQSKKCNQQACPIWNQWGEWSKCSKTCGSGSRTAKRDYQNGSGCVGESEKTSVCNSKTCPKWTKWSDWTTCSKTCGVGSRTSTRNCSNGNIGQEGCIGKAQRSEECNTETCPSWGDWERWNGCSVTCGGGTQSSSRKCNHGTVGQVGCEGSATRDRDCATNTCLGEWTEWSKCSKSCGSGMQARSRDDETETRSCNEAVCPSWSKWSEFSNCSETCGTGESTRVRACLNGEVGQDGCDGPTENKKDCNTQACAKWSEWSDWTTCSKTCGFGSRTSTKNCSNGNIGQEGCIGKEQRSEECNTETCPSWGDWERWNECSVTCGGGTQSSSRKCNHGTVGQVGCEGSVTRSRKCATNDCIVFSSWAPWSKCNASCGRGKQSRTRTCAQAGLCPADEHRNVLKQTQNCIIAECPKWNDWGPYGSCSASCGGGTKTRTRTCTGGNEACEGDAEDSTKCNTAPCTTCQGLHDVYGTVWCNGYALAGHCKGAFEITMKVNCAAACCKLNRKSEAAQCANSQPDNVCDSFFNLGLCQFVHNECQKSCRIC